MCSYWGRAPPFQVQFSKVGPVLDLAWSGPNFEMHRSHLSRLYLLLKIGPGKVVLFLNNRTQIINPLKKTVFQDLHTLKIENFKFWVKIWNRLGKSFPKMVLLLKIGSGKVVLFLNNRTQKIPLISFFKYVVNSNQLWTAYFILVKYMYEKNGCASSTLCILD